jgi:predicted nucleic acid-binding protein
MKYVIDTNVILVANGKQDVSSDCQEQCIRLLQKMKEQGVTVVDDGYRIVKEYQLKTHPNKPKGVGDVFLKWLLQNIADRKHVELVRINETHADEFKEFPDSALQQSFDPPDRKFVAVANSHTEKPPIMQAADCKWLNWWQPLEKHGIRVDFLCPQDVCRFYKAKFPGNPDPQLPECNSTNLNFA